MAQYAGISDLERVGMPSKAIQNLAPSMLDDALQHASALIDSYLRARYTLPLVHPYADEIVRCTAIIATYDAMTRRGYNPAGPDEHFRLRYEDCIRWLEALAAGRVSLAATADATPTVNEGGGQVYSAGFPRTAGEVEANEERGW